MIKASSIEEFIRQNYQSEPESLTSAGGGCINEALTIKLTNGKRLFVKKNDLSLLDMFEKEATGLSLLEKNTQDCVIPSVLGLIRDTSRHEACLILSYVEESQPTGTFHETFGKALARLHQTVAPEYGLDHDNYIGRLHQNNTWKNSWIAFFIENRIEPQWKQARASGYFSPNDQAALERFYQELPSLFPNEPASLLHGDLWGGNYLCNKQNQPVLIDPAVYYGNREIELAFTRLFGGFSNHFYKAYHETWPLEPGFEKRCDFYNLYPLLVHVNLFGGSYAGQVSSILRHF